MTDRCPSSLALEAVLLEPQSAPAAAHAKGCEKCRARLVQMEREGEDFRRFVYPATLAAVEKPVRAPWISWAFIAAPAAALAAAAVVIIARPVGPGEDYLGTKGAALKLSIYTGGAEKAHELSDREGVRANAALRFRVQASSACKLWIVSVDERGTVSRLFPAGGESGASVQGLVTLPGGAELDGRAGPERVYAVCSSDEVSLARLESVVRGTVGAGTENVRAAGALQGLPRGSAQATLLLEKKP
jgi:hypothetical protein